MRLAEDKVNRKLCAPKWLKFVTIVKQTLKTHLGRRPLAEGNRVRSVRVQLALCLSLILCFFASAQDKSGADYTRSSQPAMLSYQELVALGEQETVDPTLV